MEIREPTHPTEEGGALGRVTELSTPALVIIPRQWVQLSIFRPLPWKVLVTVTGTRVLVLIIPVCTLRAPVVTLRLAVMVVVWWILVPVRVTRPLVLVRLVRRWVFIPLVILILVTLTESILNVAVVLIFPLSMAWETILGPLRILPQEGVEFMVEMTFLLMWVIIALLAVFFMKRLRPACIAMWVCIVIVTLLWVIVARCARLESGPG